MNNNEAQEFLSKLESGGNYSICKEEKRWTISHEKDDQFLILTEESGFQKDGTLVYSFSSYTISQQQLVNLLEQYDYEMLYSIFSQKAEIIRL